MPVRFSISKHIDALEMDQQKEYLWTMATHGLELGFGREGLYPAHAHKNVVDIVFAPHGLCVGISNSPGGLSGTLMIAFPGTWIDVVTTKEFFFTKFYVDRHKTGVPDKIVERGRVGASGSALIVTAEAATALLPLFRPGCSNEPNSTTTICTRDRLLTCNFAGLDAVLVTE